MTVFALIAAISGYASYSFLVLMKDATAAAAPVITDVGDLLKDQVNPFETRYILR
jgi:hypothetical protein